MNATQSATIFSTLLLPSPFHAIFTSRHGGTSTGACESLNMALHVGDDPRRVRENRRIVFSARGLDSTLAVVPQQVHCAEAIFVDGDDAGSGTFSHADSIPEVDALVTRTPKLPLMAFSADCQLLALCDPEKKVLGVLHAGWRGLAAGIVENTIKVMRSAGADPARIHAAGSPSIGPCCFEVGDEVVAAVGEAHVDHVANGKAYIDLRSAVEQRLRDAGVLPQNVTIDRACTCCRDDLYFSHRRATKDGAKHCGRMAMIAWIGA